SAIVTPIDPPKNLLDVPTDQGAGDDPLLRWKQMQEERVRVQREQQQQEAAMQETPQSDEQLKSMSEAMTNQFANILGKIPLPTTQHMMIIDPASLNKKSGPTGEGITSVSGEQQADGTAANLPPPKVIIPAGKIDYGQIMIEANSDVPGPVLALLVSGPFSGGKLIGTFNKTNEYLVIQFKTLVTKKGTSIPIDAFAVNPDTSLTALATDVDHRYFSRIIIPAAAKFVEGLGAAIGQTTTTTSQSSTSTTTSAEKPDLKQELGKAVEEAASQASSVLEEDGGKTEILVRVRAGTPVGVMFMQAVTDQQIKQAQSVFAHNPNDQGQQNQQNQQGNPYGMNQNQLSPLQQMQQSLLSQQGLLTGQQGENGLFGQSGTGFNTTGSTGNNFNQQRR
ncbi:MAG: DotG/IcmE/VirB10 family protein, partial [Pseudomonadota bacterium]